MNLFEIVKANVTVKQVAEYYGLNVSSNNMICCPFHEDKHPSMKLNDNYYYCFGCGASGDVIQFVAKIFGLTNYEAAKKIAYDFGINPDKPPTCAALKKPVSQVVNNFRRDWLYCQRVIFSYLHLLKEWKVKYVPKNPTDKLDDRYVEACQMFHYVENLADALLSDDNEQQLRVVNMLIKDDTIKKLDKRVNRFIMEGKHNEREIA